MNIYLYIYVYVCVCVFVRNAPKSDVMSNFSAAQKKSEQTENKKRAILRDREKSCGWKPQNGFFNQ